MVVRNSKMGFECFLSNMEVWVMRGQTDLITIRGILIPVDWDTEGTATKAAILTENENEYLIYDKKKVHELVGLMRQIIEVKGVVREEAGQRMITVRNWKQTTWRSKARTGDRKERGEAQQARRRQQAV